MQTEFVYLDGTVNTIPKLNDSLDLSEQRFLDSSFYQEECGIKSKVLMFCTKPLILLDECGKEYSGELVTAVQYYLDTKEVYKEYCQFCSDIDADDLIEYWYPNLYFPDIPYCEQPSLEEYNRDEPKIVAWRYKNEL